MQCVMTARCKCFCIASILPHAQNSEDTNELNDITVVREHVLPMPDATLATNMVAPGVSF